jgi:hypothetical protein
MTDRDRAAYRAIVDGLKLTIEHGNGGEPIDPMLECLDVSAVRAH